MASDALPSLSNLATAPRSTGVPATEALPDDLKDGLLKILTEGDRPEKICERWSIWCDVKSGDAMCADTDEGQNHEHWKKGCKLLGLNADQSLGTLRLLCEQQYKDSSGFWRRRPNPTTWRGWFNYVCSGFYETMAEASPPGSKQHVLQVLSWYKLWLDTPPASSDYTRWRQRCASEVLEWGAPNDWYLIPKAAYCPLMNAILTHLEPEEIETYAVRGRGLISTDLPFVRSFQGADVPRYLDSGIVGWLRTRRTQQDSPSKTKQEVQRLLTSGADPQVAWLHLAKATVGDIEGKTDLLEVTIEALLEHIAVEPDMQKYSAVPKYMDRINPDERTPTILDRVVVGWYPGIDAIEKPILKRIARLLLRHLADPNQRHLVRGMRSGPLLHHAPNAMAEILLYEGADLNLEYEGRTVVDRGLTDRHILKTVLDYATFSGIDCVKIRHWRDAIRNKKYDALQMLLNYYGDGVWLNDRKPEATEHDFRVMELAEKTLALAKQEWEISSDFGSLFPGVYHEYRSPGPQ
jgi:hypothetical protein